MSLLPNPNRAPKSQKGSKASGSKHQGNNLDFCATCVLNALGSMVQCDGCDNWHHYECVGVDDSIKNKSWICKACTLESIKQKELQNKQLHQAKIVQEPTVNANHNHEESGNNVEKRAESILSIQSSKKTSSSVRNARLRLLEDERKERERIDEKEIRLREEKLEMCEKIAKEKLAINAERVRLERERSERFLAEKKRIIDDGESVTDKSKASDSVNDRTQRWVNTAQPNDLVKPERPIHNDARQIPIRRDDDFRRINAPVLNSTQIHHERNVMMANDNEHNLSANEIAARHVLPKDLPNFSGDPLEWAFFISSYETTTTRCGYSNAENMMRLQRCLKGNALMAVKSCLLHPEKVPEVIDTLRMMYGKPEVIIFTLIDQIRAEPAPKADNLPSLINYALTIRNLTATIEASGLIEHLNNPILLHELVAKLPTQIRLDWGKFKRIKGNPIDLRTLAEWMYDIAEAANEVTIVTPSRADAKSERKSKSHVQASHSVDDQPVEKVTATLCVMDDQQKHKLANCQKFKQLPVSKRWDIVTKFHLCRTCLTAHTGSRCRAPERCGVNNCQRWHHSLLHKSHSKSENNREQGSQPNAIVSAHHKLQDTFLFKIIPVILRNNEHSIATFAFLDDGSSITLIEENTARQLGLSGPSTNLCLKWTADESRIEEDSMTVSAKISGTARGSYTYQISKARTVKNLKLPNQSIDASALANKFSHCKGIPIQSYNKAKPSILIGLDHAKLLSSLEVREGGWSEPVLSKTRLGWCAHGPTGKRTNFQNQTSFHICDCNDESLHEIVKQQFAIDNIGIKADETDVNSRENTNALEILNNTAKKIGTQYEVGLLWKFKEIQLPDSYPMAKRRLECLEKKMTANVDYAKKLTDQIRYYIQQGYARKLEPHELSRTPRTWYLPLFTTINPNKPNKVRMVFDAAAKVEGVCLNTVLAKGPDFLTPLINILYRFRERRIGICADLKEMFHQIRIIPADQDSQRFLWRESSNDTIDEYVMQVMTFGAACSPCAAHFVKNMNAKQFEHEYPEATNAILKCHYVDDYLDSMNTVAEAVQIAKDVQKIHQAGGFELRNWHSNSKAVLEALTSSSVNNVVDMNIYDLSETEKVLGMWWRLQDDSFTYSINYSRFDKAIIDGRRPPTKREMLRILMTIYDPLGLLSSFLIYLKILMQDLWRAKLEWDQQISTEHHRRWMKWVNVLNTLPNIRIPRCYLFDENANTVQLHTFVDASSEAYAAVCYFRIENQGGVHCAIVRAKTKVAPLNPISIPRMELQGALLGTRLAMDVEKNHSIKVTSRVFWTDSRTVLSWLQGDPKQYRQFVSFRVGEILESTNTNEWRWIPGKMNVADDATKWSNTLDINSTNRFLSGPPFLRQNETDWPEQNGSLEIVTVDLKVHVNQTKYQAPKIMINPEKYSDWSRTLRVQYNVQRAIFCFKKDHEKYEWSRIKQMQIAEFQLLKIAQWEVFKDEILTLSEGRAIDKASAIYSYSPYLDDTGLLRVKGRIELLADVHDDQKWPIILPRSHKIVDLLVDSYHKKFNHMNHETVINEIRQRFAIPKIRVVLRTVRKNCQICKIRNASPKPPEMGPLPLARLSTFTRPFTFVGLDFFGPIEVAVGRRCEKRWGALFTCMSIRAVHLEKAKSLSSDSCIMLVRCFIARRGQPQEILCDRGTNFVGASNELKREFENLPVNAMKETFSSIKWSFNPPASPHMGGAWERLVHSVKKNLMFVMPQRKPTDELLQAALLEIENTINSRPLTHVPVDPQDPEAITPNHFILGSSSGVKPSGVFTDDVFILRKNWKISQQIAQHFWVRWLREYVPIITRRSKWFTKAKPIETGDIVLIVDEKSPRNSWPLGKVISTHQGKDGQTRSASIQTSTGIYTRPAVKIAVLDVRDESENCRKPSCAGVPGPDVTNRTQ